MENKEAVVKTFEEYMAQITVGEPDFHAGMAVVPLYSLYEKKATLLLLDEAIKTGGFIVTEVSESGSVPELKVINKLDIDVLIIEGDKLVGAKQNRTVNTSLLIGSGKEVLIPVSCVERGRWSYNSGDFMASPSHAYPSLRSGKSKAVSQNLKACCSYRSNQSEVWENIDRKAEFFSAESPTSSLDDVYEKQEAELNEYTEKFSHHFGQVGLLAIAFDRILGCDIFGDADILSKAYKSLFRGYALDALEKRAEGFKGWDGKNTDASAVAKKFLNQLLASEKEVYKSQGEGWDLRLRGRDSHGFALINDGRVLHTAGFGG